MPHKSREERNAYQRKLYAENPKRRALQAKCQKRWNEKNAEWLKKYREEWRNVDRKKNPEKWRAKEHAWSLKRKYGVTVEWYDEQLRKQGGVCAICQRPETEAAKKTGRVWRLAVDHSHDSKKNRGLLCAKCNTSLHRIEKFPDWGIKAQRYLDSFRGENLK